MPHNSSTADLPVHHTLPLDDARSGAGRRIVVIGAGPAAHRFVTALRDRGDTSPVVVIGEEAHRPYDRVNLAKRWLPDHDLTLVDDDLWDDRTTLLTHTRVVKVLPDSREVVLCSSALADDAPAARTSTAARTEDPDFRAQCTLLPYDELVMATGSDATLPPIPGNDLDGVFVYRTLADVDRMQERVDALRAERGVMANAKAVVIGGGVLGLEAAGGLRDHGFDTHLVHSREWLMSSQLDEGGGRALNAAIRDRGISLHLGKRPDAVVELLDDSGDGTGQVYGVEVGGRFVAADLVVWAVGITPRDELARDAGLQVHPRGGLPIDEACSTTTPGVWAIGEVASVDGWTHGLVAPANAMAEVVASRLTGGDDEFLVVDDAVKLKLAGQDVATFGDSLSRAPGTLDVVMSDPVAGIYQKLVLSDDARTLLGGVFVGDAEPYGALRPLLGRKLEAEPAAFLSGGGEMPETDLPDDAVVCSCNNVTAGSVRDAVCEGNHDLASVKACSNAGTQCGSCVGLVQKIADKEMENQGLEVASGICEHFELTRPELFEAIKVGRLESFSQALETVGTGGHGCDICKPAVANILAVLFNEHVLDAERGGLQDTNDRALANMQKDGTYSIVPRVPGGEITPEKLIVIGEIAREYGLYTKITGAQRIDIFGARLEQLPEIWEKLIDAGMESGQAYGKSLRTVKSCVGSSWCRYGVQDSVGMAVELELRYRGLRSPHKLKFGVSGCARECAEARSKDVGVIATDKGWNVYVGGNGGFTPRHAELFAQDLDDAELIRVIDRFVMYYIRSAERLQRTAPWIESLPGGIDHVKEVVLEDSLGIGEELEKEVQSFVENYQDEWAATLQDPARLAHFRPFVNAPEASDPSILHVPERDQVRPAAPEERAQLIAGATLPVRG
ncbi:nitrite reductase large subunit NirB [Brevibacterium litoralis]|uniref:nitrite reductase large subunit NirB n=1 Tax=Brevibacterium litoralis TaxID=3138935 RepID=UPI0032EE7210